jgi:hypothetical protein
MEPLQKNPYRYTFRNIENFARVEFIAQWDDAIEIYRTVSALRVCITQVDDKTKRADIQGLLDYLKQND